MMIRWMPGGRSLGIRPRGWEAKSFRERGKTASLSGKVYGTQIRSKRPSFSHHH